MIFESRIAARSILLCLIAILVQSSISSSQPQTRKTKASGDDDETPLFQEYRSVRIGMLADEVRKKLTNPNDKSDEQDFFVFSETENAQVFYDKTHKVYAISANYLVGASDIPTPKAVFGSDIPPKPDGSMYRMVRYPKAGYWVSFSRTAGDSPLVIVTLQKID
jgi:hypothetical protein